MFRYFGTSKAKFAILTNGQFYRFYTDLDETNKMDETPFLEINILDISQTIVSGYFNMMMIVDMNKSTRSFVDCQKDLDEIGAQIGVSIKCQKAEIFEKMHRI